MTPTFPPQTWVMRERPEGFCIWGDLADKEVSTKCLFGPYEPAETAWFRRALRPGQTMLDIGANIGWFTLHAASIVGPTGKVYAFEPRSDVFAYLTKSIAASGFQNIVIAINAATSDHVGSGQIGFDPRSAVTGGTWFITSQDIADRHTRAGKAVKDTPVVTVDSVLGANPVDVIKIDIEGAEPYALRGAMQVLTTHRPTILCEVNPKLLGAMSKMTPADFITWVASIGYAPSLLLPDGSEGAFTPVPLDASFVNVILRPVG